MVEIVRVPDTSAGQRLDRFLASCLEPLSRARIKSLIINQSIRLQNANAEPSTRIRGGQTIEIDALARADRSEGIAKPQKINLNIVYQDTDILVVDKQAGLTMHPGAGQPDGTLLNGLLHFDESLMSMPRSGIVHRLDKMTSGLLVVARHEGARQALISQFKKRNAKRAYLALVKGHPPTIGRIETLIGRHSYKRTQMSVHARNGRPAITHYRTVKRFVACSLLRVILDTGRTHQIRVHMAHIGHPLVGDRVYTGRQTLPKGLEEAAKSAFTAFNRQALHAAELTLQHPSDATTRCWTSLLPDDFRRLLSVLTPTS